MGAASLAIYGGLLALLTIGVFWRPPIALTAVICIFGLKQWGQSTNAFLAAHTPVTNVAIGVLILCAIVTAAARRRCVFCAIPRVTWLIIALLLYSLASVMWTPRPDLAANIWLQSFPYMLTYIVLVPLVIHEPADVRIALTWLVVVGGALTVMLLVFGTWGARGLQLGNASSGEETNPLALAGLAGSVAATAMILRPRKWAALVWPLRFILIAAGLVLILRSESRGQLIAALLAMICMLPVAYKISSLRGFSVAVIGSLVIAAALLYGFSRYVSTDRDNAARWSTTTSTADTHVRFAMVEKLLGAWSQSGPGVVFGLGNSASWDPRINGIYPHNVPMEILGEEGIVGFLIYAAICLSALAALARAILATRDSETERTVVAALGAVFVFSLINSCKQGSMVGSVEFFMYSILVARLSRSVGKTATAAVPTAAAPAAPLFANLMR
jgi:O-antigen ligase